MDLYENMMTDAMVRGAINTKRYALLAKNGSLSGDGRAGGADRRTADGGAIS